MDEDDRPVERPRWVKVGLWGVSNRASAWVYFWLSVAAAIGCVVYGFVYDSRFLFGGFLVFAAWSYYSSIRWVDEHDRWS
jgi:hypothetical protein